MFVEIYPQGNLSCSSEYGWFSLGSMYFAEILTLLLFCSVLFYFSKRYNVIVDLHLCQKGKNPYESHF